MNPELLIRISANIDAFTKNMAKAVQNAEKAGKKLKAVGKDMSTYLTLPILAAGAGALKMASDFEESSNKVSVAFGNASKEVTDFSETTLEKFGIANVTALEMASTFGDMGTSMGIPQKAAAEMSTTLVGLAGDISSFKNVGIGVATTALNSIFTGETESLKSLGVIMTIAELNAFALTQGITKQLDKMTGAEKVMLRYNFVLSKTASSQGDFERTGGGAANQMRKLQEGMKEIGQELGENILPLFTKIITKVNKWVGAFGNLSERTQNIILVVAGVVAAIGPLVIVVGTLLTILPAVTAAIASLSFGINSMLWPVLAIISAIGLFVAAGVTLWNNWDLIVQYMVNAFKILKNIAISVIQGIVDFVGRLIDTLVNVGKAIGVDFVNPMIKVRDKLDGMVEVIEPVTGEFSSLGDSLTNAGVEMGILKSESGKAEEALEKIGDTAETTTTKINELAGALKGVNWGIGEGASRSRKKGSNWDIGEGKSETRRRAPSQMVEQTAEELKAAKELDDQLIKLQQTSEAVGDAVGRAFDQMGQRIIASFGEATTAGGRFLRVLADTALQVIAMALSTSVANAIMGASTAGAAAGPAAPIVTPALIATMVGGVMSAFAAIPKFATGGIVGGNSYNGDMVTARVNSGEMILNGGQQKSLFDMANGGGGNGGGTLTTKLVGSDMLIMLERAGNKRNRNRGY